MAIFVTGDTHGPGGILSRLNANYFPQQKSLTKNDYVVICGDFGGVWEPAKESKEESYVLDWLERKNFTTLFVPGNHENYNRLTGILDPKALDSWIFKGELDVYPQKSWHGGKVRELRPSVLMLERGYVFNIDGCSCFAFGGANSHDISDGVFPAEQFGTKKAYEIAKSSWVYEKRRIMFRVNHISWWKQEMPTQQEMEHGLGVLEHHNFNVDFIFTHDCSTANKVLLLGQGADSDKLNKYFDLVKSKTKYRKWFFGHYHDNVVLSGGKDILLYEKIIQVK
ncbi:MAG TPA: metallophosphatase [Lachnospiraceae bacterium]|nr:metallophosphatase [Lachnospiraceae bacterium]